MISFSSCYLFKSKPFNFLNFLTYKKDLKKVIASIWDPNIHGRKMFKVSQNLKTLKGLVPKLLSFQGNLFTKVTSRQNEFRMVRITLDRDLKNREHYDENCEYLNAYNKAS